MNKCILTIAAIFVCLVGSPIYGQKDTDAQLAAHYYESGDYAKAKDYLEKLYKRDPSYLNFKRLLQCYKAENDIKNEERILKHQVDINYGSPDFSILLASFYEEQGEQNKADKLYKSLVDNLSPNPSAVINLYNAFKAKGKSDLAFATITKGRNQLKASYPLHFQFAEYYGSVKENKKMIQEYMDLIDYNVSYVSTVQSVLSRMIDFTNTSSEQYIMLKSELLQRVQSKPDNVTNTEMLTWFFIQSTEFGAALVQEMALDKRLALNGRRVFDLGEICVANADYTTARKAFTYVKNLGETTPLFSSAENALLNTRYKEITTYRNVSPSLIQETVDAYEATISRVGKSNRTLPLVMELSEIYAYYNDQSSKAIELLENALNIERLTDIQKAEVKMRLGDIHVLHGDIWAASLYYMQVDKDFKFEPIGHEARFKNAQIFYYDGEFNYAQSQLDVLKQGTSRLIANDAIQLSLLITDNFGLDSNFTAMYWFASADLLIAQHKYTQAFELFDSIITKFPYHSLGDEILIRKSKAMMQQGKWSEALSYLDELLKYYKEDILADDALFMKGEIYQNHLFDKENAMECYKAILFNHKGSIFTTEARKRFRELRGDQFSSDDES